MDAYLSKGTNPQILPQYELTDLNRSLLHCGVLLDEVSKYDLNDLDVVVRRREDLCAQVMRRRKILCAFAFRWYRVQVQTYSR